MKRLIGLLFLIITLNASAIHNFGYSEVLTCLTQCVFWRSLIDFYGIENLKILTSKRNYNVFITLDSSGQVLSIDTNTSEKHIEQIFEKHFKNYLQENQIILPRPYPREHDFSREWNDERCIEHKNPTIRFPVRREFIDKYISVVGGENWLKHVFLYRDDEKFKKNETILELSLMYAIGEYELSKLLKQDEIFIKVKTDSKGSPIQIVYNSINDLNLRELVNTRMLRFWEQQKIKFNVDSSYNKHLLELKIRNISDSYLMLKD